MAIKEKDLPVSGSYGPGVYVRTVSASGGSQKTGYAAMREALEPPVDSALSTSSTNAVQNKVITGAVNDLKEDFLYINAEPINLIPLDTLTTGALDSNGNINTSATGYSTTDFIHVENINTLIFANCNFFCWYDENESFISPIQSVSSLSFDKVVQKPASAHYLRISIQNDKVNVAQCGRLISRGEYIPHEKFTLPNLIRNEEINIEHFNIFNKNIIENGYLAGNGELTVNANYITSTFMYVGNYTTIMLSKTNFIAWYDINKVFLSLDSTGGNTLSVDKELTVPENAKYLRITGVPSELNNIQVGENVSRYKYVSHDPYKLINLKVDQNDTYPVSIIVDVNGGGDYTSLTEALYNNVDTGINIIVKPGTYNVVSEYIALFTEEVVASLADSTNLNGFQMGMIVRNRKITFESGSHVVCDWSGHTVDGTHRFAAFRIEPEAELVGLDLDCTGTFYAIHDDYGTTDNSPYTIKYENCRVIGHSLFNANCIGGGAHKYSRHILNNCYFNNNVNSSDLVLSADVRYHNTNTANAEPELYVSNCYFSNNMNVTYYGAQTTKMKAYVNNCFAPKGIIKRAESSTMTTDNVDLYVWNNQTS